ncbi:KR domain-containing protein [Hypoxylon trugodes]|uniref:KR domain-containing protein n=1 Tax=Hypoxylon trugodes TaxID=326681 RepID=UPI002197CD41|nr:KR domain-containing protein [Hypoxylon trugodes]KAI1387727.1 KR domain-containing protein [Hypoxylon trugodes]
MPSLIIDSEPSSGGFYQATPGSSPNSASEDGYRPQDRLEPIAVIGMGCRLPGDVGSPAEFWDLMMKKETGNTPKVPAARFDIDAHFHKNNDRPGSFGVLGGYFLDGDLSGFDPALFNITPIEAMWMDPQQRKLLEVVYEALESGGITLDAIAGTRTAVFAASFTADFQQMSFKEPSFRHSLAATGVDPGIISNRISHVFNLNGPSVVCNTACSSSVYALHNACNALRNHEAEGAIVGGVNLIITVDQHMNTAKLGVLSQTSTCHTFDVSADGYGRADAVGAVYLKRLSDAVRDGDPIRGLIRSSATNSNGKAPAVGITYPNRDGQAAVIAHAYERGEGLDPLTTGYFECHGTGTPIGDPIEVEAVSIAMNKARKAGEEPLLIGAVKPNIGHSEAASGLSALIKAILTVERGVIPPTRGVVNLNPKIEWEDWQVKVVTEPTPFPAHLPVRRVSVNSFGYGGTNAHMIVESAESLLKTEQTYKYIDNHDVDSQPRRVPRRAAHRKRPFLLPFSAHDKPTLLKNIAAHGKVASKYDLLDLSYTLANRRSVLSSKGFAVVSYSTLDDIFSNAAANFTIAEKKKTRRLGFVFTGQGAQWSRMGSELMQNSHRFLRSIRHLDHVLGKLRDGPAWSIEDALLEPPESSRVAEAEFSQPLCTAIQIALVQLLEYWGIRPAVVVGHSSGEIAAAYAAGLISADEAIILAYFRGIVSRDVDTDGAMLAVGLGASSVAPYLEGFGDKVVVACHNSPSGVTLSGDTDALDEVQKKLAKDEVFARKVNTNGKAYHSHHMAPVAAKYERLMRTAKKRTRLGLAPLTSAKMVSSVTNSIFPEGTALDETYWSKNLRSPVLFNQAVQTILTTDEFSDVDLLVEIGPHSALKGPVQQIKTELKLQSVEYLPTLLRGADSAVQLLNLAGEIFLRSYPVDMERITTTYNEELSSGGKLTASKGSIIVDLPPYQWNYARPLWAESRASQEHRAPKFPRHDLLGSRVIGASLAEPTWRNVLRTRDLPWLKDHSLGGEAVLPAAAYFAMVMEAVTQLNELSSSPVEIKSYALRDISIQKALTTPDNDEGTEVLTNLRPSAYASDPKHTWWDFGVSSIDAENNVKEHMLGSIAINTRPRGSKPRELPKASRRATGKAWNQALRQVGFDYGPTFQDMDDIRFDGENYWASCSTRIKQHVDESLGESRYPMHPASLDSVLQLCIVAIHAGRANVMDYGAIPIQLEEVTIWPPTEAQIADSRATGYAWCDRRGIRNFNTGVQMTAHDGELVAEVRSLHCVSYEAALPQKAPSVLNEAPFGEMSWEVDFDQLKTSLDVKEMTSSEWANLALFKYPTRKILHLGSRDALKILQKNPRASCTVVPTIEDEVESVKTSLAAFHNVTVTNPDELHNLGEGSFDMLVVEAGMHSVAELFPSAWFALKPRGQAFINHFDVFDKIDLKDLEVIAETGLEASVCQKALLTPNGHINGVSRSAQLIFRETEAPIISLVQQALEELGWDIEACRLDSDTTFDNRNSVIMLADFERPLLHTIVEGEFLAVQKIIDAASSLLWVTVGGLLEGKYPEFAMVEGLARTIASEQASIDFRTIDVDLENTTLEQVADSIVEIAENQAAPPGGVVEREFRISHGKRYISRLVRNNELNTLYVSEGPQPKPFSLGERVSGKVVSGKVIFEQDIEKTTEPGHVEVQVLTSGLTKEGVLVITGNDYPTTFSHEVGGIITKVGPGVEGFKTGDKVVGFHADKFSSYQQIPVSMLCTLGDGDNLEAAVGVLTTYASALYGLQTLANVEANEKVLVLPNTGTSGLAAIQIAQEIGATPYVIANTTSEVQFLREQLGLGVDQIILISGEVPVGEQIKNATNGQGADVVYSSGSTDINTAGEAWRCIAPFGRFVDGGRKEILRHSILYGVPTHRGAHYLPFDILGLYESRPAILSKLLPNILETLRRKSVVPLEKQLSVQLGDLDKAVARFSEAFDAPIPIIQYEQFATPIMMLPTRPELNFNPDSTYLLVGCLGGLGRSLTSWMMRSGARRFVFLSRSGVDKPSAANLVEDIEAAGAITQVVRGDATSRDDVVRAVRAVSSRYPIKGVVHAAMVLRDGLFGSMTFESWKTTIEPKVVGAANLHSVLANEPLEFFLMMSSVSGILGNPAQSNYAAANSYLDSLARHRFAANKAATSLILPMVLEVGVVSESSDLEYALKRKGMYGIDEEELLESFEAAILSTKSERAPDHIVVGLDPAKLQATASDSAVTDSYWLEDARFSQVVYDMNSTANGSAGGGGGRQDILANIKAAASPTEAINAVIDHFKEKLARMLLLEEDAFEIDVKSIATYGIDSMVGAELRKWIFKEYSMDIPFQQLLGPTMTISKFARQVCERQGITDL